MSAAEYQQRARLPGTHLHSSHYIPSVSQAPSGVPGGHNPTGRHPAQVPHPHTHHHHTTMHHGPTHGPPRPQHVTMQGPAAAHHTQIHHHQGSMLSAGHPQTQQAINPATGAPVMLQEPAVHPNDIYVSCKLRSNSKITLILSDCLKKFASCRKKRLCDILMFFMNVYKYAFT